MIYGPLLQPSGTCCNRGKTVEDTAFSRVSPKQCKKLPWKIETFPALIPCCAYRQGTFLCCFPLSYKCKANCVCDTYLHIEVCTHTHTRDTYLHIYICRVKKSQKRTLCCAHIFLWGEDERASTQQMLGVLLNELP